MDVLGREENFHSDRYNRSSPICRPDVYRFLPNFYVASDSTELVLDAVAVGKSGCSADLGYFHGGQFGDKSAPSCFCATRFAGRMAKEHRDWSVVENKRVSGGRVVQKHVLYLGEINGSQELAWRKSIEVLAGMGVIGRRHWRCFRRMAVKWVSPDASIVRLKLSDLRLCRPRQWGACWLALYLWQELRLDRFWAERSPPSRKGTRWDQELFVLVAYRLLAPGSEWRLHRHWFEHTALADLLGADFGLARTPCSADQHRAAQAFSTP